MSACTYVRASEWGYCPISKLSDALRSRKISASEVLEHTIARKLFDT